MVGLSQSGIHRAAIAIGIVWSIIVATSLAWNLHINYRQTMALAIAEARANFNKDQAFRLWATEHGGVYVPVNERTQPNPNLSHIPERDITTDSGKKLTLMNPAYMLRQMMDEYPSLYGTKGRITSLKPLWKGNAPDEWEAEALRSFESGAEEAFEVVDEGAEQYLRLMRPMITEEGCLKCHAGQGYKEGDVRGGVGVKVPLAHFTGIQKQNAGYGFMAHGAIWLIGLLGLVYGASRGLAKDKARIQAEEKTRESEQFLQTVIDGIVEPVMVIGRDYRVRLMNRLAAEHAGTSLDDGNEHFCYQLSHHRDMPCSGEEHGCPMSEVLATGRHNAIVHIHTGMDGTQRHYEIIASPLYDSNGAIEGIIETSRDITERVLAERILLRGREQQLELTIKAANLGTWDWNIQTNEAAFNERWAQMLGYSHDEIEHHITAWQRLLCPEDRERVYRVLQEHLDGKSEMYQTEHRLLAKSGEWKWIMDCGKVVERDSEGRPVRATGIHLDIDRQKRSELELHQALRDKEMLIKEVHHRVKNNLAILQSLIDLQLLGTRDDKTRLSLSEVATRIKTLSLVHERLYRTQDVSSVEMHDYLTSLAEQIYKGLVIDESAVRLELHIGRALLHVNHVIPCGLILNELLTNAFKYAFPANSRGTVSVSFMQEHDKSYRLTVRDDGIGLPAGFNPEESGDLGMKVVRALAWQLNGGIKSHSDKGTTFIVTLKPEDV